MARPGRTERNRAARSFRQLRRFHHVINSDKVFGTHNGARNRHSDNEKFCIDLNGPKTPKMSERPLKTLRYFETTKLNTRVRFPSPAPALTRTTYPAKSGSNPGIKNGRIRPRWRHSVHREKAAQDRDGRRQEAAWPIDGDGRQGQG